TSQACRRARPRCTRGTCSSPGTVWRTELAHGLTVLRVREWRQGGDSGRLSGSRLSSIHCGGPSVANPGSRQLQQERLPCVRRLAATCGLAAGGRRSQPLADVLFLPSGMAFSQSYLSRVRRGGQGKAAALYCGKDCVSSRGGL